jgi:hypothetical protein
MIAFNLLPEDRRSAGFPGPGFRRALRVSGLFGFAAATWLLSMEFPRAEEALEAARAEQKRLEVDAKRAETVRKEIATLRFEQDARIALESGRRDLGEHLAAVAQGIARARETIESEVILTRAAWLSGAKGVHSPLLLEGIVNSQKLSAVDQIRDELSKAGTLGTVGPAETSWRNAATSESEGGWQWKVDVAFPGSEAAVDPAATKGKTPGSPTKPDRTRRVESPKPEPAPSEVEP